MLREMCAAVQVGRTCTVRFGQWEHQFVSTSALVLANRSAGSCRRQRCSAVPTWRQRLRRKDEAMGDWNGESDRADQLAIDTFCLFIGLWRWSQVCSTGCCQWRGLFCGCGRCMDVCPLLSNVRCVPQKKKKSNVRCGLEIEPRVVLDCFASTPPPPSRLVSLEIVRIQPPR